MSPTVSVSVSVLAAALVLAGCVSARPGASDDWTPRASVSQSRAFGASQRSYSVASPAVNAVHQEAAAAPSTPSSRGYSAVKNEVTDDESWFSWLPMAEMRVIGKVWDDCADRDDMSGCLKGKALTFLDRASRKERLSLPGGLQLVRSAEAAGAGARADQPPVSEAALEAELPRDLSQREQKLDSMLLDRVLRFVQTHALRFNLADDSSTDSRGIKKKDLLPYLLLGKLVASSMVAMAFTGLALLAGKALMVSKIALLLSGIVALKKLFSHGQSGGGGVEVVNVPSGHGHYGRSLDGEDDSHDDSQSMAYRGQIQRPATRA